VEQRDVTLYPVHKRPIEAGVEVFTPRGFGTVVSEFVGDPFFTGPRAFLVELDDDQGRTVVRFADLQVVERVGA